jgi:GWxTD domain-containing protein
MRSAVASLAGFVAVLAIASGVVARAAAPAGTQPLRLWRDGPVSVLLDGEEYDRFGALRTDDERRAFIEQFWREMDADPDAGGADFRATFEKRCEIADARYQTIHQEGWRTTRGRVYLVLGEPSSVRHETGGMDALEKEVWTYGSAADPAASFEIAFYRCPDWTYRTEPSCQIVRDPNSVAFDWERTNYLRTIRDNNPTLSSGRIRQLLSELLAALPRSVAPAAGAPPTAPVSLEIPIRSPEEEVSSSGHQLEVVPYYFRAQDGSALALITLEFSLEPGNAEAGNSAGTSYLAAASFEELGKRGERLPAAPVQRTTLDQTPTTGGVLAFAGRAYLESGRTYAVRYAVQDGARGQIFARSAVLTVPDLGSGFAASSLVPAERFGPAGSEAGRFQVGSEEVVPKVDASFRRSELLRLYLQVYGAAVDPGRLSSRVDVVFRFQRLVNGAAKRFGKPFSVREAAGAAMGLALPIGDWPPGPYRVTVDLHDRVSGDRLSVVGSFSILAD